MRAALALVAALALGACETPLMSPERAAAACEQRARGAQGPTGHVMIGANSREGSYGGASIGISSDFLQGRDPVALYEECVWNRSGQAPIRPPRLR